MKIRSITYFCNPGASFDEKKMRAAGMFATEAQAAFEQAGYEVQTTRLATIPFPNMFKEMDKVPDSARTLSKLLPEIGIAYASLGPALPEYPESYRIIPDAIAASNNIFFSGILADPRRGIALAAARACADVIIRTAPLDANGFANLNFAALANVPPGAPFFPAAYHEGDDPEFALALETADLAVSAFSNAKTVEAGRQAMVDMLEEHARALIRVADFLKYRHMIRFGGMDFSLAPFPEESRSLGAAFERLGVPAVGLHGSLAAAAILTESIESAHYLRTGFSGLMMPVLEDAVLARRAAEGVLTVKDLLLYSAVCGTGLDTIPLPGDVSREQLTALLLDLSAMALRLEKPLTARLMPVPGKVAGDVTDFDFGYFANSRVMRLDAAPLKRALGGSETFSLQARKRD